MVSEYARLLFAVLGLAVGYTVGGPPVAVLASIFGFFLGHVFRSTTRTVKTE